jgi:hypothetical protein
MSLKDVRLAPGRDTNRRCYNPQLLSREDKSNTAPLLSPRIPRQPMINRKHLEVL